MRIGCEGDWKLKIRYNLGRAKANWKTKEIMHSELDNFIIENGLNDGVDLIILEIERY